MGKFLFNLCHTGLNIPSPGLPILEFDGKTIGQSIAIARFMAKEYNLAGKNNFEAAQCDMFIDCMTDFLNKSESNAFH